MPQEPSTKYPDIFAALASAFDVSEVKQRTQAGRKFSYITARTAMNRLDAVLGPENWSDRFTPHENMVICCLTIRLPDGKEITKSDSGGHAGMQDSGDDEKSAFSDAFKRACVKFGVGRYLYGDGVPNFRSEGRSLSPIMPVIEGHDDLSQPQPQRQQAPPPQRQQTPAQQSRQPAAAPQQNGNSGPPTTGKALYSWGKDRCLLDFLTKYGRKNELPVRIVDWDREEVEVAFAAALEEDAGRAH